MVSEEYPNENLVNELERWSQRISAGEAAGLRLRPHDCYRLGLLLECAYQLIPNLQSQLDVERSALRALDPEGSRRRMELQRAYGPTPFEKMPRSPGGRFAEAEGLEGKPQFRNL